MIPKLIVACLLTWCVFVQAFHIIPEQREAREDRRKEKANETEQADKLKKAREAVVVQQATILQQQKETRAVMEANSKLAEEINQLLKRK